MRTPPSPEQDRDDSALEVTPPRNRAGGPAAVAASLRQVRDQLGVRRAGRLLLTVNQDDGIDCPGCAWPEGDHRHTAEFCENGVKALAEEATTRRIDDRFWADHPVDELVARTDHWLGAQGRLTAPVVRREGSRHFEPIGWDDALDLVADRLATLDDPDRAVFYTSGRASNEAAYLYGLFARTFGTNNLPDCSNLCHESSGVALKDTIGIGKASVTIDDIEGAELILVVGQNPGTNHPRMLSTLARARARGAHIVAINPLPEAGLLAFDDPQRPSGWLRRGGDLAGTFLQIRLGGDQALFQMLGRLLLEAEDAAPGTVVDRDFVDTHTDGFESWAEHVRRVDWGRVLTATGLTESEIRDLAARLATSRGTVICWAMGLTQHAHAVATIADAVALLLLGGHIGRPGAGVCPVRGHSNVQGDRTMGVWERPDAAFLEPFERRFGVTLPRAHGYSVVEAIEAMASGRVEVVMSLGGNLAAAAPDTGATWAALSMVPLHVQVSTKLNRGHLVPTGTMLVLPCLGRTERHETVAGEQVVSVEDSMGHVHASRGRLRPASPALRSEPWIVAQVAERVHRRRGGPAASIDWNTFSVDHRAVRAAIASTIAGFENMETRLAAPGGFRLAHPARDARRFPTSTGRARFLVHPLVVPEVPGGRLLLQTLRSHDQFNTTVYGRDDRYRGVQDGRRVVFVHPDDLAARGLADGDLVDLVSEWSDGERRAPSFRCIAYPTARGCAAAYFPEANVLVPLGSRADRSLTPTSKSIVVRLDPPTPLHVPEPPVA